MNRVLGTLLLPFLLACGGGGGSSKDVPSTPDVTDPGPATDPGPGTDPGKDIPIVTNPAIPIEIDCKDGSGTLYAAPGTLPADKGAILKCVTDTALTRADLQAKLDTLAFAGNPATSGATVHRILYRTERGTGAAAAATAIVYLPDNPAAEKMPVVVASHGSRGQAGVCAPSKGAPEGAYVQPDFEAQVLPLVAAGFPVIAPDLAGYANFGAADNPPSAYASAADVARSTLDAVKALRALAGKRLTDQIAITGHSQGGHTALSSLALSGTYGVDGKIAAVATYAPLWLSQRSWGALFLLADMYKIADVPSVNAVSVWYHYTQGELYDGAGHGKDVFATDKQEGIKQFVFENCWADKYPALEALGTTVSDLFSQDFQQAIMVAAGMGTDCPADEPGKSLCEKWIKRYTEDRPHLAGDALSVPILLVYGGKDTTIPPDRFQCAIDRLEKDKAAVTQCFAPEGSHGDILKSQGQYVIDWLKNKLLGMPIGVACPADKIETGKKCASLPPND
jgi:pimeloyl-ACP methyl ester carboxylesterase